MKLDFEFDATHTSIPRTLRRLVCLVVLLAMVPPLVVFRARSTTSPYPRIHPIPDMDSQLYFKAQQEHSHFADGRAMRPPVAGTVARDELLDDDHYYRGRLAAEDNKAEPKWATGLPSRLVVDDAFMARGRERYEIFCAPCHGFNGDGQGPVAVRVSTAAPDDGTNWTPPTNLVGTAGGDASPSRQPLGQLFGTITDGVRNMPSYKAQIPVADRWAIVGYVKALQRSQVSLDGDVPTDIAERLHKNPGLAIPFGKN